MSLDDVLARADVWRARECAPAARPGVPSGWAMLDACLPGGGWPRGALIEMLVAGEGMGALAVLLPALVRLGGEGRWIVFVAPPHIPYAPALAAAGIDLARVLVVSRRRADRGGRLSLWACEQALRSGAAAAVLAWIDPIDMTALRRLQLAADAGDALGVLFRSRDAAAAPSPAAVRILVDAIGGDTALRIVKIRGAANSPSLRIPARHAPCSHGERGGGEGRDARRD
ncbi:MAG: translesion DNA synthesis-associated protein ImuA [Gammaproteobacteria bacterium]|nr:translesion DNA synthesis-associated protein ImuA [Gammaproteobacteria bacterium]